jgi:hypothetical protein
MVLYKNVTVMVLESNGYGAIQECDGHGVGE